MQKAGGLFSIFAASATLFVGALGCVFEAAKVSTVATLGWSGILFSLLIIFFGIIAVQKNSRKPGLLLILCALAGAFLGTTLVSIFMLLAMVGGILNVLTAKTTPFDILPPARRPSRRGKTSTAPRPPVVR